MQAKDAGKADYSYWLTVRMWSADEAAALLLGYEPDYTSYFHFPALFIEDESEDVSRTAIRIAREKLEKVLVSAQLAGELGKVRLNQVGEPWGKTVKSFQWIAWAQRNSIQCAEELLDAVEKLENKPKEDHGEIHPRTETSLLRIIGALIQELRGNTGQSQSSIIEKIVDQHGHKDGISRSTLENYFSEANRRLSDW